MDALRDLIDVFPAGEAERLTVSDTLASTDLPFLGPVRKWRLLTVRSATERRIWLCGTDRDGRSTLEPVLVVDAFKGAVLTGSGGYLLDGWADLDVDLAAMRRRIVERAEDELAEKV